VHEGARIGELLPFEPLHGRLQPVLRPRRQRPVLHLEVGGGRQVDAAGRRQRARRGGDRRHREPVARALQEGEELLEPPLAVDPLLRAGPQPELLAVVTEDEERAALRVLGSQERLDLRDRPERDQVAQPLRDREEPDDASLVLGRVPAVELVGGQPRPLEMGVVDEHVLDAGEREVVRQLRLPDPFGQPEARHVGAEEVVQPRPMEAHLVDAVEARDRREDRLVEARRLQFDLPARDAFAHEPQRPALTRRSALVSLDHPVPYRRLTHTSARP
jgi:hypothetical protein